VLLLRQRHRLLRLRLLLMLIGGLDSSQLIRVSFVLILFFAVSRMRLEQSMV
jgi:hypothetical protein